MPRNNPQPKKSLGSVIETARNLCSSQKLELDNHAATAHDRITQLTVDGELESIESLMEVRYQRGVLQGLGLGMKALGIVERALSSLLLPNA